MQVHVKVYVQARRGTNVLFSRIDLAGPQSWDQNHDRHIISLYVVVLLFYFHGKHLRSCRDGISLYVVVHVYVPV